MTDHYRLHAQFCRSIASPKRLHILDSLRRGPMTVTQLSEALGVSASNISQHIAILRQNGIIRGERQGTTVLYSLAHPELMQAYDLISGIMRRVHEERGQTLGEPSDEE
jgi:ArsR family transcriptional regulator